MYTHSTLSHLLLPQGRRTEVQDWFGLASPTGLTMSTNPGLFFPKRSD